MMKYCSACGQGVTQRIPQDDNRPRYICNGCGKIHYENPRLITGTLPISPDGRILLCRRNIEPRKNYWTLPAGFMENGETTIEGALRETYEEARVTGLNPRLFSVISLPAWNQIHLFYRVDMPDFSFETTPESNDVRLFSESDIPWDSLAFRTVLATIQHHINLKEGSITVLNAHFDQ